MCCQGLFGTIDAGMITPSAGKITNRKGKGRGRQGGNTGAGGGNMKREDDDDNGVANKEFFLPVHAVSNNPGGPALNLNIHKTLVEQHTPEIVLRGLVNNTDIEKLFEYHILEANQSIHWPP
ncbi:uncharacterized protein F5147DRAFT_647817 [Suillus discolor]|uniref:Uncharacterized protein n=1 Tax=Suillus discolor TaxID=1912936 RepID=A0A9P7K090_9AGAM|nr:uncharacterized protein F5147DRAFT_647817 [Suillus discolor]KAG2118659.1 hypothetical protein F5147DRAFT_647817 [Suillus discolor]